MSGKLVGIFIMIFAIIAGAGLYYTQVYAFYEEIPASEAVDMELTTVAGNVDPILADDVRAIDSDSSPIRYRACFTTPLSHALLTETYELYENPVPLTAPDWFDCFDADAIAAELQAGTMLAFLGEKNVRNGVDRVVAISEDGRGFVWHELNQCFNPIASEAAKAADCPPDSAEETN